MDQQVRVIAEVIQERKNQDRKWGGTEHVDQHTDLDWLSFIDKYASRVVWCRDARDNFIKIAALAVAAVKSIDRRT